MKANPEGLADLVRITEVNNIDDANSLIKNGWNLIHVESHVVEVFYPNRDPFQNALSPVGSKRQEIHTVYVLGLPKGTTPRFSYSAPTLSDRYGHGHSRGRSHAY